MHIPILSSSSSSSRPVSNAVVPSTSQASSAPSTPFIPDLKVNVGTPGNVRSITLASSKTWTVAEVLARVEIKADGYDIRVNGNPSTLLSPVTDGQTVLLLAPVRGNTTVA